LNDPIDIQAGFLCINCYRASGAPAEIPSQIVLRRCIECHSYSLKGPDQEFPWVFQLEDENDMDFMTRILLDALFSKLEKKNLNQYDLFFKPDFSLQNIKDIEVKLRISTSDGKDSQIDSMVLKYKEIHCPHCAKIHGGRFDSVLQLRYYPNTKTKIFDQILHECELINQEERVNNPANFVSKIENTQNGVDLKLSTLIMLKKMVNRLKNTFNFTIKHSRKLMGRDSRDGSDLYRHYILLKNIPFEPSDRILMENEEYIVRKIQNKRITLEKVDTGKITLLSFTIFDKKKWLFKENV
jgi:NMD protein affecting ribosome stability and mRNA decay